MEFTYTVTAYSDNKQVLNIERTSDDVSLFRDKIDGSTTFADLMMDPRCNRANYSGESQ